MVPMLQCGFVRWNLAFAILRLFFWKIGPPAQCERAHN
jgi:hypothetical protein